MENTNKAFNDIAVVDIDGNSKTIGEYFVNKKVTLIVNVASACGYTNSNYKQLSELHKKYSEKGLQILGFPCNQFGGQEPKCEVDIKNYVSNKFKVEFPLFSKIEVNGAKTHPLYIYLKLQSGKFGSDTKALQDIPWNFAKFLVDNNGKVLSFYPHNIEPNQIEKDFQKYLV